MTLIGVDLNATRARALHCTAAGPAPLPLEGCHAELPLALSLENRTPAVGKAGLALCRKLPHLACMDFLPHLGTNRQWSAGRHRLDAAAAFGLVCQHLQPRFAKAAGVVVSVPAYLGEGQASLVTQIAEKSKWKVLGAVPAPLATVLAAHEYLPWSGTVIVVDVDGYALTWSAVTLGDERARLVDVRASAKLSLGLWLRALVDGVARRCVRMSRRDPRACADSEQSLFEQLLAALNAGPTNGILEVNIQSPHWYQNLMLPVDELAGYAKPLAELALNEMKEFLATTTTFGSASAILVTAQAGRLPGLTAMLEPRQRGPAAAHATSRESDFGEGLLEERPAAAHVLDADAVARAAYDLAARFHRGELTTGWLEEVPLPPNETGPVQDGPARLHYQSKDHVLKSASFVLGREPACDLVFETDLHPSVSARHCEITREPRGYVVHDRSRHGTFLNDRPVHGHALLKPGDWIRLGPGGPLVRFLGQPGDPLHLVTFG